MSVFDDPRTMPEVRRTLLDMAHDGGSWDRAEQYRSLSTIAGNVPKGNSMDTPAGIVANTILGPRGLGPDEIATAVNAGMMQANNAMHWARTTLAEAQLIHVAEDLCDVLYASRDTVPLDTVLDESMMPSPSGLVLFQTPFIGIDSGDAYDTVRVDMIAWGRVKLPARDDVWGTIGVHPGIGIAAFRWMDPWHQDDESALHLRRAAESDGLYSGASWVPLGRSDWVVGDPISAPTHVGIDPSSDTHASMVEDRQLVAALWALIQSKRLTERTRVEPSRPVRRRLERKGDTLDKSVTVIHLRRPEYRPTHDDGSTGRRIGVRFVVRPHWRHQAYGPQRSLRKLILVPPHIKGPPDAPMTHTERIWSLDR